LNEIDHWPWHRGAEPYNVLFMRRSTRPVRALWRITVLLQLLLPTFVSIADARAERDAMSARAYSHVEATTGKDCARAHKPDCALCQHLSTPLAKAAKPAPPIYNARGELPAVVDGVVRVAAWSQRPTLPRAPPAS
jgi:hypothetical protein